MDAKELSSTLNNLERKVLPLIREAKEFSSLVSESGLKDIEVMRALQWLQNKNLVIIKEDVDEIVELGENGKKYAENGLPEIKFLNVLEKDFKPVSKILKEAGLEKDELNICIGTLKKKSAIDIRKNDELEIKITSNGKKFKDNPGLEQIFLDKIKQHPVNLNELKPEEKFAFDSLRKRKDIIRKNIRKTKFINITELGKAVLSHNLDVEYIEKLTPKIIRSDEWKTKKFRRYDVKINVPKIKSGKRHFVKIATDYAKKIWLNMGFKEMTGTMVNTSFWNFDALYTAQDHPVRELQDTFYIGTPGKGRLPDKKLVNKVKQAHEKGTNGSIGWRYDWQKGDAKKNVLRTHTTVLSAKTIAELKESDVPKKYFALGRCFRNETMDWSHLFEFNQTEGIVIDPDANFRHLLGYLKQFFKQMGFPDARFRPAHFPYTEPSVEIDVYHPIRKKWIELGGAGIFRPEMVEPLFGKFIPILAWGPGFDRIILEYYNITDIRDLYKNDIKQLREIKYWLR